ncbi:hypothetical protein GCM10010207_06300 [Streptomyces atratus]|uniref:hypothetical protein n=1 Tax=Streptomyces atratus TaxID=1893 RepID=UPI00167008CD|nr:hypothetical protein [Streptomyces atratus]GGT10452.1 hypothetical protein GCM10010207_06300 [Streptomyces atratus]
MWFLQKGCDRGLGDLDRGLVVRNRHLGQGPGIGDFLALDNVRTARGVIAEGEFRRVIRPGQLGGAELGRQLLDTRDALVQYLAGLDISQVAMAVRQAAMTELEYTT